MSSNCWRVLVAFVVFVAVSHEIGGARATDSAAMQRFKKTLSTEEKNLLKRHMSKSPYIQSLFERSKGADKRDLLPVTGELAKRSESAETACCSCNANIEGCYHPTDVKRSKIIRCCIPEPAKRDEITAQEAIADASPADQQLLQKHQSKVKYLVAAAQHPEGADANSKRSNIEGDRDITKRLMTDINLAKKYGIRLDDLLASLKRRSIAASKNIKH